MDNPDIDPAVEQWLRNLQRRMLCRVRIRRHTSNQGASAARNSALDEALGEYVVFWDDDVTPSEDCLPAYIAAFKQHPQVGAQGL